MIRNGFWWFEGRKTRNGHDSLTMADKGEKSTKAAAKAKAPAKKKVAKKPERKLPSRNRAAPTRFAPSPKQEEEKRGRKRGRSKSPAKKSGEKKKVVKRRTTKRSRTVDKEYEVEKIVAEKTVYLVKWKNYPQSQNQWLDEEELAGSKELLEEWKSADHSEEKKEK